MAINLRRVVTGHAPNGTPIVSIDDVGQHTAGGREGFSQQQIWTTADLPVRLSADGQDEGAREFKTSIKYGSVFRVVEYAPGVAP